MRSLFLGGVLALLALAGCKPSEPPAAAATDTTLESTPEPSTMSEPMPEKRPHEMTLHGDTRIDEYYWLRDDSRSDPKVLAYLEEENAWFDRVMEPTREVQETLYEEMVSRLDPNESSVPYEKGGWWYYYRYEPNKDYAIYARRKGGMEAPEEVLVDGNARAEGHAYYSLGKLEMSDDHR